MVRTTEILSVSVSKDQAKAINDLELSPSSLLQEAIDRAIEHARFITQAKKDIESLKQSLFKATQCFADFLNEKGLDFKEYNDFVYGWNKRKEGENGTNKLAEG